MTTAWRDQLSELSRVFELREQQLLLAQEANLRILQSKPLAETLRFIVTATRDALRADHVDILFEYTNGLRVELSSDAEEEKRSIPVDRSISGLALHQADPVLRNDVMQDPVLGARYFPRVARVDGLTGVSVLAARITYDGAPIGVVNVEAGGQELFGPAHAEFVRSVAGQISVAIAHATLFDEDRLRRRTDSMLLGDIGGDNDVVMREVLVEILEALRSFGFIEADAAEVLFADPQDPDFLTVAYSSNTSAIGVRVALAESVCGEAFRSRNVIVLDRAFDHPHYHPLQEGMKCEMAIPINLGGTQRFAIGVLNIESSRENAFSQGQGARRTVRPPRRERPGADEAPQRP